MNPYPFQLEDLAKLRANNYTGLIATEAGITLEIFYDEEGERNGNDV